MYVLNVGGHLVNAHPYTNLRCNSASAVSYSLLFSLYCYKRYITLSRIFIAYGAR